MNQIKRNILRSFAIVVLVIALSATWAFAGFIDYEDGLDGNTISSSIDGLEFTSTGGHDWVYGDWRTDNYNGPHPDGAYFANGNFFAWLGSTQDSGRISFTEGFGTYFTVAYSSQGAITLTAYDQSGGLLGSDNGGANLGTGEMAVLRVDAPLISYVVIESLGNYWMIDDLETDAITQCTEDAHCDDEIFCNGAERCIDYECVDGTPPDCSDDGLYCNGQEFCDDENGECGHQFVPECQDDDMFCNGEEKCSEEEQACVHTGDPCAPDECDEVLDVCPDDVEDEDPDDVPGEEDLWPEGTITGGCCGCGD